MAKSNLERMIELADEVFDVRNDPDQLSVNEETTQLLRRIDSDTMTEERDEHGPIAWVLLIPTTPQLMSDFVEEKINEWELLCRTPVGERYETVYICSALVLPEHRGKGTARRLVLSAMRSIQTRHPVRTLFCWPFSVAGEKLAESVASVVQLPLLKRQASDSDSLPAGC